jgi:tetratricopeptide (TPR) repeat protein
LAVSSLLVGLIGALVATNQPAALSNLVLQTTGLTVTAPRPNNPADKELDKLMADDDAALAEIDNWITENQRFRAQGAGIPDNELNARIRKRLDQVRHAYDDFIKRHPDNAPGRIAYASFLDHIGEEDAEVNVLEEARKLDPKNPAAWNQLANYYGHRGPIHLAFEYYEKAIALDPSEPVYYWNLATTVYLYRKDSEAYYHLPEQQIFDKAMALYGKALELDPANFELATDLAETYYGIKPLRAEAALASWTNALHVARNEIEREGVYIHLARVKYMAGRYAESRAQLGAVTNAMYAELKRRITRNLDEKEGKPARTNAPPAAAVSPAPADRAQLNAPLPAGSRETTSNTPAAGERPDP